MNGRYGDRKTEEAISDVTTEILEEWPVRFLLKKKNREIEEIIGEGRIHEIGEGIFRIRDIFVDESERGKGYGSELLRAMEDYARESGGRKIGGEVTLGLSDTVEFFKRNGYGVRKPPNGIWIDEYQQVWVEKELKDNGDGK